MVATAKSKAAGKKKEAKQKVGKFAATALKSPKVLDKQRELKNAK